jgi:regulator of protease activity HflC (stomatin/prohibitin superfamily)
LTCHTVRGESFPETARREADVGPDLSGMGTHHPASYFRIPIIERVQTLDVKTQKEEMEAAAASKDLQTVTIKVALNYNIDPAQVARLYQEVGPEYKSRIIDPAMQEGVKSSTAKFTAEELITKREAVREDTKAQLKSRLQTSGIIVRVQHYELQFSRYLMTPSKPK